MLRILFDANMPLGLRAALSDYHIDTAFEMGWGELVNGVLMAAAEAAGFDAMITGDKNIAYQQNLDGRRLALIVLSTNHWPTIRPQVTLIAAALSAATPGSYTEVPLKRPALRRRVPNRPTVC